MSPRARRRALAALGLALLAPLAGEAWLRFGLGYGNPRRLIADPELGWRLAPAQVCEVRAGVPERIDARGTRDREPRPAIDDRPLVHVCGGAAAFGHGVAVDDAWPRVLERELRRRHPRALVRNLASPGYVLEQQLAALERESRAAAPDVVVLELAPDAIRPMRVLHEPERFPMQRLAQSSALWDWVRRTWLVRPRGEAWDEERRALADPDDPANAALWAAAQARLAALQGALAARGARLVLVEAPALERALEPALVRGRWSAVAREIGALWIDTGVPLWKSTVAARAELAARGLAREQVWNRDADAARTALAAGVETAFFVDDPAHPDAAAHAVVGRAVASVVARELPPDAPQPLARFTRGDPIALALAPDGRRAWRVDGARASELALDGARWTTRRSFDVEGPVFAACESQGLLVLAAGERGLLFADLAEARPLLRTLAREQGRWCSDVEAADGRLWSTFAARDGSRLVAFDARTLVRAGAFELPAGTAWAVAARGARAWIALGEGGIARADLELGLVEAGPGPGSGPWNAVRDVALAGAHLAAACDGLGVAFVSLDAPWSSATPLQRVALELDGRPTYASRVAGLGARVAVGTNLAPVAAQEGAPFGLAGWMDERLRIGGIDVADFEAGTAQGWFLLEREGDAWREHARASGPGGWRSLALAGDLSWEQHVGEGLVARRVADGALLASERPAGLGAVGAELALDDPELLLPANDPSGSVADGWPRLRDGALEVDGATRALEPLGLIAGPQWRDDEGGAWCLFGTPTGWNLWRIVAGEPLASRRWSVAAPPDADGARGGAYFSAALDGDLLAAARAGSREGLLVASARELVARARAAPAGTQVELPVRGTLRTHALARERTTFAWEPALDAARGLALLPCGIGDAGRARWLLVDVAAAPPRALCEVEGALARGHAVAAAFDGARAVLVDFLGDVLVVDLADPSAPRHVGRWSAAPDAFDGRAPNLLDVALAADAQGRRLAWIAAGRAGLLQLELRGDGTLELVQRIPTDGWTTSVRATAGGRLAVGDQKGGARVFEP